MKILLFIIKVLLMLLLVLNVFFWMAGYASGHNLPAKTDWSFGISSAVLLGLVLLLHFFSKRRYPTKS